MTRTAIRTVSPAPLAVLLISLVGCGGGSPAAPPASAQAQCGPTRYVSVVARPDELLCDVVAQLPFSLTVGGAGSPTANYDGFLYKETLVSRAADCSMTTRVGPFNLTNNTWSDDNGVSSLTGFAAGCEDVAITDDQWAFDPATTPDLEAARRQCGLGFSIEGYKTVATKISTQRRSGDVISSCKAINQGPSACIDYDVKPNLSLSEATLRFPAAGGSRTVSVVASLTPPATETCRSWSVDGSGVSAFADVVTTPPARRTAPGSIAITVRQNSGPARLGTITVQYAATGVQRLILIQQDGAANCASVAGGWTITDTATIASVGSFCGPELGTRTAVGTTFVTQSGCDVSYVSPANVASFGTQRTGLIAGSAIQITGPWAIINPAANVTVEENRIDLAGTVSADGRSINVAGNGVVRGLNNGMPATCTVSTSQRWTR